MFYAIVHRTMPTLKRRLVLANKRVLGALRSPEADTLAAREPTHDGFASLHGAETCLVVTYTKKGKPIAQPVWPGHDTDKLYVWTEEHALKAKRVKNNPEALVAPCTFRGKPLGAPVAAQGRILTTEEERAHARARIRENWGWKQKLFELTSRPITDVVYLEFTPR